MILILTCEHATNTVPTKYQFVFGKEKAVLQTHEAYDPGAYDLFTFLKPLSTTSYFQDISRLLVETNRSLHHTSLFSRYTKQLESSLQKELLDTYYNPYRQLIEDEIKKLLKQDQLILHLSIHSFTPVLNDVVRNCDIGILYDPGRAGEREWSEKFKMFLSSNSGFTIRKNYPYLGKADGFTTYFRTKYQENYLGIELEINQKWVQDNKMDRKIKDLIYHAVELCIKKAPM